MKFQDHYEQPVTRVQTWVTKTNRCKVECCHLSRPFGIFIGGELVSMEPILSQLWFSSVKRSNFNNNNKKPRHFYVAKGTLYSNDQLAKLQPVDENMVAKFTTSWTPPLVALCHRQ